jgi:hypothetical protein
MKGWILPLKCTKNQVRASTTTQNFSRGTTVKHGREGRRGREWWSERHPGVPIGNKNVFVTSGERRLEKGAGPYAEEAKPCGKRTPVCHYAYAVESMQLKFC